MPPATSSSTATSPRGHSGQTDAAATVRPSRTAVKLWCLGNEMDGPWQIGRKTAAQYGQLAAAAGRAMRRVDPSIELVACGSSNARMATFGAWERTVLEETYDIVDYVSMHSYYEQRGDDRASFLACAMDLDDFIDGVVATCDHVRALRHHSKRLHVSLDEWNVWYQKRFVGEESLAIGQAPALIEDTYNVVDAVVVGNLLISMLRHADRVRIGCQAQLVNVIAPIRTEAGGPAWRQTTFYPFALTSRYGRGSVMRTEVQSPTYSTSSFGDAPVVDAAATLGEDGKSITVFVVNRDQQEAAALTVKVRELPGLVVGRHTCVYDDDPDAVNSEQQPDRVRPRELKDLMIEDGHLEAVLPPTSWSMIQLLSDTNRRPAERSQSSTA